MKSEHLFTLFFTFFILISFNSFSQTDISGIINAYSAIDSIYPTKDTIEVANASLFAENDTVMVYQVKGAQPVTNVSTNPYNFGGVRNLTDLQEAGKYEIILVQKVEGNRIIFKAFLNNDYDTDDLVQIIRVPSYKSATVASELTCEPWDGSKGGVLALMVSDTLHLNADINVSGKGFRGASPFLYDTLAYGSNCSSTDSALYGSQYFNEGTPSISAGYKGEGIAKFDNIYRKGLGRWANGGGGGNARFSGGGGGGNSGNGGYGGEEDTILCETPAYETNVDYEGYWNALGGSDGFGLGKQNLVNDSTIFFGGGGGSGTYKTGLIASSGGAGGGIVVIIARVIESNGNNIISDGESIVDIVSASGGGGGAGGSIVFDIESVVGNLTVSTKGGAGGTVEKYGLSGPGGGGGGGPVLWNTIRPPNVTLQSIGGMAGRSEDLLPDVQTHMASSGSLGTEKINIKVPLTGFLFNSISTDHAVCMNDIPNLLVGTEPRGGTGAYSIQWQHRTNETGWSDISGATSRDYQPPALNDTTYYKRIVTSGSVIDNGNEIQIIVHDYVVNNNIIMPPDSVICIGNAVDASIGTRVILGGNNVSYQYKWEYSFDSLNWTTASGALDTAYTHGEITDTKTYIRRVVISGACEDTASLFNPITGLIPISNNTLPVDQEICEGQTPEEIIANLPADGLGSGTYTYQWQESSDGTTWVNISGATNKDYQPPALIDSTYYRRMVYSDDCVDESDTLLVSVLRPIDNDLIETGTLIYTCYNTAPIVLNGSTPINGDGTYTYQWQESTDGLSWSDIGSSDIEDYQPGPLTSKTYYKRLVSSGLNGCCTSETDSIVVDIYPLPIASVTSVIDTICSGDEIILSVNFTEGQNPFTLTYSDGYEDATVSSINTVPHPVILNPVSDQESKEYNYTIVSVTDDNGCEATDMTGLATYTVYGIPATNAGTDAEMCELAFNMSAGTSYGTGAWMQIPNDGATDFTDNTSANTTLTTNLAGVYEYIWTETNWQCQDSDTVKVVMYEQPSEIGVNPQDTILYFIDEIEIKGSYVNPDTFNVSTFWEIINGLGTISPSPGDSLVTISDLNDAGMEKIDVTWTVSKGVCIDSVKNISIKLRELFTPTGFTPNGDGVNDFLIFNGVENSDENELIIYNRWGTEVYSTSNYSNDWDGKNNSGKDLPEDTYYYILNVTDDNITQTHKGFIVLKRY